MLANVSRQVLVHILDSFQAGCHTSVFLLATLGSGIAAAAASTTLIIATTQAMIFVQHGHLRLPLTFTQAMPQPLLGKLLQGCPWHRVVGNGQEKIQGSQTDHPRKTPPSLSLAQCGWRLSIEHMG